MGFFDSLFGKKKDLGSITPIEPPKPPKLPKEPKIPKEQSLSDKLKATIDKINNSEDILEIWKDMEFINRTIVETEYNYTEGIYDDTEEIDWEPINNAKRKMYIFGLNTLNRWYGLTLPKHFERDKNVATELEKLKSVLLKSKDKFLSYYDNPFDMDNDTIDYRVHSEMSMKMARRKEHSEAEEEYLKKIDERIEELNK